MTISGERTEQLNIFCHVTGFISDFLSFIDVEHIRFFHRALQLINRTIWCYQRRILRMNVMDAATEQISRRTQTTL